MLWGLVLLLLMRLSLLLLLLLLRLSLLLLIADRGRLQLFSGCVPPVLDDSSQHA